jgi:3-oxoadipate enol-lactonase
MTDYTPFSIKTGLSEGPALLLLNSLGTTVNMWDAQLPLLEQYFCVVRMDTRGHGQSATPPAPYSFDMLMADAFGVMDSYGLASFSVMGCSLGSMTALGMGVQNPTRIERIVCVAARADAPPPFKQSWDDRIAVMDQNGVAALWEGSLGNWLTPAFRAANPDVVAALKTDFLATTNEGYRGCAMALKQLDVFRDLCDMTVPTLFVAGSEDKGAAPATMEIMAAATPGAQFVVIQEAGHIVNVNNGEAFELAISAFLGMNIE